MPLVVVCTGYRHAWRHSEAETERTKRTYSHLEFGEIATWVNRSSHVDDSGQSRWAANAPRNNLEDLSQWVKVNGSAGEYLLLHGYAFAVTDQRATGASFGKTAFDAWSVGRDLADLFSWFAQQEWCNAKIGMIGSSWLGGTQLFLLNYGSPYFKAAIPQGANYDVYDTLMPGGMYSAGLFRNWSRRREQQETELLCLPVDDDPDGKLLKEAYAERVVDYPTDEKLETGNSMTDMMSWSRDQLLATYPLKDRELPEGGKFDLSGFPMDFERANNSDTAVYFWGGWWDMFLRGTVLEFNNYSGPRKLILGPWHHASFWDTVESLRWFDYWLKDIDNGIMDEPACVLSFTDHTLKPVWRGAPTWPLQEEERKRFYTSAGPSGTIHSINDGKLTAERPEKDAGSESFQVDYTASAGRATRGYYEKVERFLDYSPLEENDKKGLTYTTDPLEDDIEIAGHPVVTLFVSSTAAKGTVMAYLEEIDGDGRVHSLGEGGLNLEFRKESSPSFNYLGLPYHGFHSSERSDMTPGHVEKVSFELFPLFRRVKRGHRLRLAIHGADRDNYHTTEQDPPPELTVHRERDAASLLELPLVDGTKERSVVTFDGAFADMPEKSQHALVLWE